MRTKSTLIVSLSLILFTLPAAAGSLVYVINGSQQFGTVDVSTGAFQQIGPTAPEAGYFGLAAGPNGSLVTFAYSSNVYSINSATGVPTLLGPSGLDDCTIPASPCGPTSNATLGGLAGRIYATDFQNSLYNIDPITGSATLIGPSGIPAIPFVPGSFNADGTINFYDAAIFGAAGKLYATFDALTFDLGSLAVTHVAVAPYLYQTDPSTALATPIGPTALGIGGVVGVNGTYYAFNDLTNQILSLDLANGNTSLIGNFDFAAGVVQGASPVVPEPASIAIVGVGLTIILIRRRRANSTGLPVPVSAD